MRNSVEEESNLLREGALPRLDSGSLDVVYVYLDLVAYLEREQVVNERVKGNQQQ